MTERSQIVIGTGRGFHNRRTSVILDGDLVSQVDQERLNQTLDVHEILRSVNQDHSSRLRNDKSEPFGASESLNQSQGNALQHQQSFMYTRRKLKKVANNFGGYRKRNNGLMPRGTGATKEELDDERSDVIEWNFDHDDLTKPIWNISSPFINQIQFPIFDYDEPEENESLENEDMSIDNNTESKMSLTDFCDRKQKRNPTIVGEYDKANFNIGNQTINHPESRNSNETTPPNIEQQSDQNFDNVSVISMKIIEKCKRDTQEYIDIKFKVEEPTDIRDNPPSDQISSSDTQQNPEMATPAHDPNNSLDRYSDAESEIFGAPILIEVPLAADANPEAEVKEAEIKEDGRRGAAESPEKACEKDDEKSNESSFLYEEEKDVARDVFYMHYNYYRDGVLEEGDDDGDAKNRDGGTQNPNYVLLTKYLFGSKQQKEEARSVLIDEGPNEEQRVETAIFLEEQCSQGSVEPSPRGSVANQTQLTKKSEPSLVNRTVYSQNQLNESQSFNQSFSLQNTLGDYNNQLLNQQKPIGDKADTRPSQEILNQSDCNINQKRHSEMQNNSFGFAKQMLVQQAQKKRPSEINLETELTLIKKQLQITQQIVERDKKIKAQLLQKAIQFQKTIKQLNQQLNFTASGFKSVVTVEKGIGTLPISGGSLPIQTKDQACQTDSLRDSFFEDKEDMVFPIDEPKRRSTTSMLSNFQESRNSHHTLFNGPNRNNQSTLSYKYNSCMQEPERNYKKKQLQLKLKQIATMQQRKFQLSHQRSLLSERSFANNQNSNIQFQSSQKEQMGRPDDQNVPNVFQKPHLKKKKEHDRLTKLVDPKRSGRNSAGRSSAKLYNTFLENEELGQDNLRYQNDQNQQNNDMQVPADSSPYRTHKPLTPSRRTKQQSPLYNNDPKETSDQNEKSLKQPIYYNQDPEQPGQKEVKTDKKNLEMLLGGQKINISPNNARNQQNLLSQKGNVDDQEKQSATIGGPADDCLVMKQQQQSYKGQNSMEIIPIFDISQGEVDGKGDQKQDQQLDNSLNLEQPNFGMTYQATHKENKTELITNPRTSQNDFLQNNPQKKTVNKLNLENITQSHQFNQLISPNFNSEFKININQDGQKNVMSRDAAPKAKESNYLSLPAKDQFHSNVIPQQDQGVNSTINLSMGNISQAQPGMKNPNSSEKQQQNRFYFHYNSSTPLKSQAKMYDSKQKEDRFSQFNEKYQKAQTFWKSKFDELLNEKKKHTQILKVFNQQMQNMHEENQKTKKSLKKREKNIEQMFEKMLKQQSLLSQLFQELKPIQTSKSQLNLHRYEMQYQMLKDDLKKYHDRHIARHSTSTKQIASATATQATPSQSPAPAKSYNKLKDKLHQHRHSDLSHTQLKRVQAMPPPKKQSSDDMDNDAPASVLVHWDTKERQREKDREKNSRRHHAKIKDISTTADRQKSTVPEKEIEDYVAERMELGLESASEITAGSIKVQRYNHNQTSDKYQKGHSFSKAQFQEGASFEMQSRQKDYTNQKMLQSIQRNNQKMATITTSLDDRMHQSTAFNTPQQLSRKQGDSKTEQRIKKNN